MSLPSRPHHTTSPPATCVAASWEHHPMSSHAGDSSDSDYDLPALSNEEDEESVASGSEADDLTRGKRRRQRIHFDVEQLQTVYHLPLKTAAERLGICEAALKRICRRNLIQKWPYRQLSSVRRRITELNDRRIGLVTERGDRLEHSTRREFENHIPSVTPAEFDTKLQQLEEEQNQIIRLAHQPRRLAESIQSTTQEQPEQQRPIFYEEMVIHFRGIQSTIANLPPLDLSRVEHEFPLLLLANVCESVRAYTR